MPGEKLTTRRLSELGPLPEGQAGGSKARISGSGPS